MSFTISVKKVYFQAELLNVPSPQKTIDYNKIKSIKILRNSEDEKFLKLIDFDSIINKASF